MEAVGRLARHLRKRWAGTAADGPGAQDASADLAEALAAVLRMAGARGIDLGAAIRAKEAVNRLRTWTF